MRSPWIQTGEDITKNNKNNDYHFITNWQVQSTVEEVSEVLGNPSDLVRWWPSVYLDVKVLEPGDEHGLGKVVSLYTKGWLPYTLRWNFRVTAVHTHGFTLVAWGDFNGRGIWTFEQQGPWVDIRYDWKISAEKPLLRYFSFLMKPIFSANHRWAMAKGEESLRLELDRRHAKTEEEASCIPAPPRPTSISDIPFLLRGTAIVVLVSTVFYLLRTRRLK